LRLAHRIRTIASIVNERGHSPTDESSSPNKERRKKKEEVATQSLTDVLRLSREHKENPPSFSAKTWVGKDWRKSSLLASLSVMEVPP
jgi:hypothetical protein